MTWIEDDLYYIENMAPIRLLMANPDQQKAIALFVMGVPAKVIEKKMQVKGNTIQGVLKKFHIGNLWAELSDVIQKPFPNVSQEKIDELEKLFERNSVDNQAFRKAGIRRTKLWESRPRLEQEQYCSFVTSGILRKPPG